MAYASNILPKASAYYTFNGASITGTELNIDAGGYAEIQVTSAMLPTMSAKMLVTAHPSVFSSNYRNDGPQINISIITASGNKIELLIPISEDPSGVFNTEIDLPEESFYLFTYRISSPVPVTFYNWELCAQAAADISTIIDGVEQTIPKLLYDYNTYAYAVGQRELTVGLISAFLHSPTDLQGHFTISFFATERCNVHVRIKDNYITELFSPQVYTVEKGYASVSIPHAYLNKLATNHTFSVTMQCSNGQLSIPVRGVLYTIDGGYLATRLLDAGIDVEDITVKQLATDEAPSAIYAVGFESNHVILKSREYSLLQRVNWVAHKDFGEATATAVEFPGLWNLKDDADRYTLETEENPVVLIVDNDGILKAYTGPEYEEITEIDTNVSMVCACQGFSSMIYEDQNQGLVVMFIKEGNVYYSQYVYNYSREEYVWSGKLPMYTNGDASFVSLHRLPDYRLGVLITNSVGTKWYITGRTYVAQGIKPEFVKSSVEDVGIATVLDVDKADTINGVATQNELSEDIDYYDTFSTTFDNPLVLLRGNTVTDLKNATRVFVDDELVTDAIDTLAITEGNTITVVLKEPVKGGRTVKIDYHFKYIAMIIYNGCYSAIIKEYSWDLPSAKYREYADITVTSSISALVKPLTESMFVQPVDRADITVGADINAQVKALTTVPFNTQLERADISVGCTIKAIPTLVGNVPI